MQVVKNFVLIMKAISMTLCLMFCISPFMAIIPLCWLFSVKFDTERGLKCKSLFQISKGSVIEVLRKSKRKPERKQTFPRDQVMTLTGNCISGRFQ